MLQGRANRMVVATCLAASAAGFAIAESARAASQLQQSSVNPETLKRVRLACARAAKRRERAPGLPCGSALRYASKAGTAQRSLLRTPETPVGRAKARRPGKRNGRAQLARVSQVHTTAARSNGNQSALNLARAAHDGCVAHCQRKRRAAGCACATRGKIRYKRARRSVGTSF